MDFDRIRKIIKDNCLLDKDRPVLVGISGGPDSLCLLILLKNFGYNPLAVIFDHQLRQTSADEVCLVKEFAQRFNIPFFSGKMDVGSYAENNKLSIEEAARICRYKFLFAKARELSAQAVAVAHHADDQIETVLMHFLRGSGMGGLRGMAYRQISEWDEKIPIVRPLLDIWKEEIESFIEENEFHPVQDETNQESLYFRNRIRNELIPYLGEYNPGIKNTIFRLADTIREDDDALQELTELYWDSLEKISGTGFIALETEKLAAYSKGIQRRLVRKAISLLRPGLRDFGFDTIERVLVFIMDPPRSSRMELSHGLVLVLNNGQIIIAEEDASLPFLADLPQIGPQDLFTLEIPGKLALKANWSLSAEICPEKPSCAAKTLSRDAYQVFLDAESLGGQVIVRSRRAGDRFSPLGMKGKSQKLSDFFINEKMVLEARDGWPLILSENKIVWVPGYRPADFCRIKESTRKMILIKLSKTD